jgi:PKD repeat protein
MKTICTLLAILCFSVFLKGQCTDCTPDETCINDINFPQVCPEVMPVATSGEAYDEQMTFFLPSEVTDPESGLTVDLIEVVITSVDGLPFGLDYIMNYANNTYYPSDGDTWGCATPLIAGEYEGSINAHVTTLAFGFEVEIDQPFLSVFTVLQGEGGTGSFGYDNFAGCGSMDVNFEALIDGNPQPTTWEWDFGNGNVSSAKIPATQTYTGAGDYLISLQTDVYENVITSVLISGVAGGWSGDIEELTTLQNPDPYFVIYNINGVAVYTSSTISDATSGAWTGLSVSLSDPPYTISFFDEDSFSDDDYLGNTDVPNTEGTIIFDADGTQGSLTIGLQPGESFYDETTLTVFPAPNAEFTVDEDSNTLVYADTTLVSYLWFANGDTISDQVDSLLVMSNNGGVYQAYVSNVYGCDGWSSEYVHCPEISIQVDSETSELSVVDIFESYQWFYNGLAIDGATASFIFAYDPGNFSVQVTTDYGCESMSEVLTITTVEERNSLADVLLFPNPSSGRVNIQGWSMENSGTLAVMLYDITGKISFSETLNVNGQFSEIFDLSHLPKGLYMLNLNQGNYTYSTRLILQ